MSKISSQHALAFAVGLISGAVVGILLTSAPQKINAWREATTIELPHPSSWLLLLAALLICLVLVVSYGPTRFKELFALTGGERNLSETVREELRRQAVALSSLAARHHERAQASIVFLEKTDKELISSDEPNSLKRVLESLQAENERNLDYTRQLERDLRIAQQRAASLQLKLTLAEELASLDPLTSIANRRRFDQFLSRAVEDSHGDKTPLSVILGDLDRFKLINDDHGHEKGDEVLKLFARTITKCIRVTDLAARYGGEEFAVVLPRTPAGSGYHIAERIREAFASEGPALLQISPLSASFGVAEIQEAESASELMKRADEMLYAAKQAGRNNAKVWHAADVS